MEKALSVWLIDDDTELTSLLSEYLCHNGLTCEIFNLGAPVLTALKQGKLPDLMVLDVMMPGLSGLQLLPSIRSHTDVPVIMLTGRGEEIDRILGLELGADDYISKPCNPRELLARVQAVSRRYNAIPQQVKKAQQNLSFHGIALDLGTLECTYMEQKIELTGIELSVLSELMKHSGQLISKADLTERILHRKLTAYDRSIDVHVSRVRQKLKQAGLTQDIIKTVRGQGYQFIAA